jgi:hypothetical protein
MELMGRKHSESTLRQLQEETKENYKPQSGPILVTIVGDDSTIVSSITKII